MAIYYFILLLLTCLGYILTEKKQGKRPVIFYLALSLAILTLTASFRYAIGFDYFSYRNIYNMIAGWSLGEILHFYWYEPLFFLVCKLFAVFGCSFPVFLACINLFLFFVAGWFIYRHSKIPWMSIFLFITLQFFAYDMNLVRQAIAVSFFLLAYPHLKARRLMPFTALILIGGLFHNSLLPMWLFYFLLPLESSFRLSICLAALAAFGYFLFDPLFFLLAPLMPEKYAGYLGSYFWNSSRFIYVMPSILYGLLIYLFRNRISESVSRSIYLNSAFFHFLFTLFITKHYILERFSIYPFALSLIAIPEIITGCRAGKKTFATLIFLLFGAAYFCFAVAKGFHNVYPYISLLDRSCSAPH